MDLKKISITGISKILIISVILLNLINIFLSGNIFLSYPLETHINYISSKNIFNYGIPKIDFWTHSSAGLDILNYLNIFKNIFDSILINLFNLKFENYYYVSLIQYFIYIFIIYLFANQATQKYSLLLIFILLVDNIFQYLSRPSLQLPMIISLLSLFVMMIKNKKFYHHFLIGFLSVISFLTFFVMGFSILMTNILFYILMWKTKKNYKISLLFFMSGILFTSFLFLIWINLFLNNSDLNLLKNIILNYIHNYNSNYFSYGNISGLIKSILSIFYSDWGFSFITPSIILVCYIVYKKNFNYKKLSEEYIYFFSFLIISLFLCAVFPLHFYYERVAWILPFTLMIIFKESNINVLEEINSISLISLVLILLQIIFSFMTKITQVPLVYYYLILSIILMITVISIEKCLIYIKNIQLEIGQIALGIITLCFLYFFLNIGIITKFKNFHEYPYDNVLELNDKLSKIIDKNSSVITNWPIKELFPKKTLIYGFDFFMEHKKVRKFLHAVPFNQPEYAVFIDNSKNKKLISNLNRLNQSNMSHKNIDLTQQHYAYIRGYDYKLLNAITYNKFDIFIYVKSKTAIKNKIMYENFSKSHFLEYKKNYLDLL